MPSLRAALPALGIALGLALSGCAHYRLGPGAPPAFATLYVAPVVAAAPIPQAQAVATSALREAFARDGRVRLVDTAEAAEAVLEVTLVSYGREVATVQANDTGLARKFDLTLTATATLRDPRAGRDLFTGRPLSARRQAFTDSPREPGRFDNQGQAEYQALPILAEALATRTVSAVLDVW
jgi:outer membrane lipopolysaccharide assembly protein LptE/RlpB